MDAQPQSGSQTNSGALIMRRLKEVKHRPVQQGDLLARIVSGKYQPYTYLAPMRFKRTGYKFNQLVYVGFAKYPELGFFHRKLFKDATRQQIADYLKEFRKTREYERAKKRLLK